MLLKLSLYEFKLEYQNIKSNHDGNHKDNSYRNTQKKMTKEFKTFTIKKNQLKTKDDAGNKEQKAIRHLENKQHNDRSVPLLISNCCK